MRSAFMPISGFRRLKYFSISKVMPSAGMQQAAWLPSSALRRTSLTPSPSVCLTKSSVVFDCSAFSSAAFFSSSVARPRSSRAMLRNSLSAYFMSVCGTNSSTSSVMNSTSYSFFLSCSSCGICSSSVRFSPEAK